MTNTQHPSVADDATKLLPCPFCGSAPMTNARNDVWCNNDDCAIVGDVFSGGARHWNMRKGIDTLLAAAREEGKLEQWAFLMKNAKVYDRSYFERAEKAEAALAEAQQTIEVQRATLQMVRNYPDFDEPESPFGMAIDEALAGRAPWLLGALHDLFNLRAPEPRPALAAAQPPAQADTPNGDWPKDFRDIIKNAEAAARAEARQQIPDGWQLVPKEPTPKMVDATFNDDLSKMSHNKRNKHIYRAMLAAAPAASCNAHDGWHPIETAPKDGTSVLIWTAEGIVEAFFRYGEWDQLPCYATYDGTGGVALHCKPTHWMPLPAAPQQEVKGDLSGCGKCPKETPYGEATCGKCLKAAGED